MVHRIFVHVLAIVLRIPSLVVLAVRMEKVITVVTGGRIHFIVAPSLPVVVHMEDGQSLTRDAIVPFGLTTVFQQIELILVA